MGFFNNLQLIIIIFCSSGISQYVLALNEEFCSPNQIIEHVFAINDKTYFVSDQTIWCYDIKSREFAEMKSLNPLFYSSSAPIDIYSIITAVHFDFDACDSSQSEQYCLNAEKAKDLVIFVIKIVAPNDANTNFYSYRWKDDDKKLEYIGTEFGMPWNMTNIGLLYENRFWSIPSDNYITGFAFTSHASSNILYASAYTTEKGFIYRRSIKSDGVIEKEWHAIAVETKFLAIFLLNGNFFALNQKNELHRYLQTDLTLNYTETTNIESLFDCNSNVSHTVNPTDHTTTETTTSISDSQTTTTTTALDSRSSHTKGLSFTTIALLIALALLIVILIIIIIAVIFVKSRNKNEEQSVYESDVQSASQDEQSNLSSVQSNSAQKSTENVSLKTDTVRSEI